jgi:hypothetical protein
VLTETSLSGNEKKLEEISTQGTIEAPYLQLVMTRLWNEELRTGSHQLQRETLIRLGGVRLIVRTHLDTVMKNLSKEEQDIASSIFNYLVTPSGTKIAHTVSDLAEYSKR